FEWVESDCDLDISRPAPVASDDAPAAPATPADDGLDLAALLASLAPTASGNPAPAEAVPLTVESAPAQTSGLSSKPAEVNATIRVDLVRVDRLIDLVGELVINEAMLNQRVLEAGVARASGMNSALDSLSQLTREIQDSVMAIRAQPVRSVFQRMPRLVREVAAMTGKSVRLVTEGEGTEVDKTVVERLSDPLTHMIRNAIDHGLETPAIRRESGKPEEGVVRLSALHRSGRIVIEVADDGAGLDRARIKAKAAEKGLIAADAVLSDEETDNLIFMPGFSTAATISDISGRGVGLDVVRRSVQSLGGRISIASRPGKGSTFTLSLPLTLAVLDGMVVTVAGHTLVVPLGPILETLKPDRNQLHALGQDGRVIALRGGYIPVVDVGVSLGYRDRADPERGVALLVEGEGGERVVLQVDEIQGQRQIVIKSLEANYAAVRGIAAATVMGDGRVALILDVDAVIAASKGDGFGTLQDAARAEPFLLEMR
ncbi:MAG: chemotaxis protein CheA, partial [Janthinobacterium lividum]